MLTWNLAALTPTPPGFHFPAYRAITGSVAVANVGIPPERNSVGSLSSRVAFRYSKLSPVPRSSSQTGSGPNQGHVGGR